MPDVRATALALATAVLLPTGPLAGQETPPATAEGRAVVQVVTDLFDAMRDRDTRALRAVFHPDARLVTVGRSEDGEAVARTTTVDDFARAIGSGDAYLDETMYDPEVRIDGDLAQLWTYYELHVDGQFSHCGVDAFQMVRSGDGWAIVHLADTRRREGCRRER